MGKIDKLQQARMDGMVRALDIVEAKGADALKEEIRFRNATGMQLDIDIEKANETMAMVARRMYMIFVTVAMWTIHELWHHGKKGLHDFKNRFNEYVQELNAVDYYGGRWIRFKDMATELNTKYDMDLNLDEIATVDELNDRADIRVKRVTIPAIYELLKRYQFEEAAEFIKEFWGKEFFDGKEEIK